MAGAEDPAIFLYKNKLKGINNNMAVVSFNNQALSAYGLAPLNLSWSLSSTGTFKTVELLTVGTGPLNSTTLSAKQVEGIAFNTLTSPASGTGSFSGTLSAATGTTFRVDRAHNGAQFAVIYKDGTSSLFTCATATVAPAAQTLTFNNDETGFPEITRLVYLGYR